MGILFYFIEMKGAEILVKQNLSGVKNKYKIIILSLV